MMNNVTNLEYFASVMITSSVVGIVGNIIILLAYWNERDKLPSILIIEFLAVVDLLICVLVVPYSIILEHRLVTNNVLCHGGEFMRHCSVITSNLSLFVIAGERYFGVCRPLKRINYEQIRIALITLTVISFVSAIPAAATYVVTKTPFDQTSMETTANVSSPAFCQFTTRFYGPVISVIYKGFLLLLFAFGFISFVVFYGSVYYTIVKQARWRRSRVRPMYLKQRKQRSIRSNEDTNLNTTDVNIFTISARGSEDQNSSLRSCVGTSTTTNALSNIAHGSSQPHNTTCAGRSSQIRISRAELKGNAKAGTMLFVCTLIYLITWIPFWVDVLADNRNILARYAFLLSHSTNPIIYGVINSQVREKIAKIFKCKVSDR